MATTDRKALTVHDQDHPRCATCARWTDLHGSGGQGRKGDCSAVYGPNTTRADFYCAQWVPKIHA